MSYAIGAHRSPSATRPIGDRGPSGPSRIAPPDDREHPWPHPLRLELLFVLDLVTARGLLFAVAELFPLVLGPLLALRSCKHPHCYSSHSYSACTPAATPASTLAAAPSVAAPAPPPTVVIHSAVRSIASQLSAKRFSFTLLCAASHLLLLCAAIVCSFTSTASHLLLWRLVGRRL
jgi:hypothetical protein